MIREFHITHEYAGSLIACFERSPEGFYQVWLRDHMGFTVVATSIGAAETSLIKSFWTLNSTECLCA